MKYLFLLLALTIGLISCSKDDNCDDSSLGTAIIGEWDVIVIGLNTGSVEFKSGGELVDEDDALVGGEAGGMPLDQKSYTVNSNLSVTVRAENDNGSIEYDIDVLSYDCDEIEINVAGFDASLRRD